MRNVLIWGLAISVVGAATAVAQETQHSLLNQAVKSHWLQLTIDGGRVVLDNARVGNFQSNVTKGDEVKEQLTIRNNNGLPSVTYEWNDSSQRLVIDISAGDAVRITRSPRDESHVAPLEFVQLPGEPLTLTMGGADRQSVYHAAGFWHLVLSQPQLCRENLLPLLEMLQPDWKLADRAAQLEARLVAEANPHVAAERREWTALVAQLADDRFAKREAADRALRAADPAVLGYLCQLDFARLDAEQQFRVQRITAAISGQLDNDAPDQTAAVLAGDPAIWLALLERSELATRKVAARQLIALLGEPIPVDPAADPATQHEQRAQLRVRIEQRQHGG